MNDNPLFALVRSILLAGVPAFGLTPEVKQSFQPTTQGVDTGPTLYFTKLFDTPYGSPQRKEGPNGDFSAYTVTMRQNYETHFQINASFRQTAEDISGPTAGDLANSALLVLQNDDTQAALIAQGVSVLRISSTVRNLQIVNGEGEYEAVPSFDFVLKHERVSVTTTPAAVVEALRVARI